MNARIGSLCSGYGGLDLAVMDAVPGTEVAWHAQYDPDDRHQYAARILAHRWPGIPNLGDITRADWFDAEPVDILTAGYPCQPISFAGKGLVTDDARWIWPAVAQCIRLLRPGLVFLENVSAHLVRGAGDVVADLARLGYVGSWLCLRASDVGAPHQRKRLFILAQPADADAADLGYQWGRQARRRRSGSADGGLAAADTEYEGRARLAGPAATQGFGTVGEPAGCRPDVAADTGRNAWSQDDPHGPAAAGRGGSAVPSVARGVAPTAAGDGRDEGRPEPAGILRGSNAALGGGTAFGPYAIAVRHWESVLGRPAPAPVDARGRLAPPFVEWMMGAPAGWVTNVPGIPRNAQLKALGNGVVRQQGAAAFRILSERLVAPQ